MDYHKDRFEDFSLLIFKDETLVAVLPANREEDQLYSHQGLTYGGLVYNQTLKLKEVAEIFNSLLKFLDKNSIEQLHLKTLPSFYASYPNDEINYLLFILDAKLLRSDVYSVIDKRSVPISLSNNRKRGLRRAKDKGLIVKEEKVFDTFWNAILIPNLKVNHQASPTHNLEEIKLLKSKFPKQIRQFNVYKDQEIVGGSTIFETKQAAHAQYISANNDKQELGSLDALFDYLIQKEFKHKAYFSFGISNENQGKNINQGLLYWKESFGARSITHGVYAIKTKNHSLLEAIFI